jgi:hypothetical protein
MPNILLTHPVHGSKFALSNAEIEHDEKHGWVRYTDDTLVKAASRKGGITRRWKESSPNKAPDFLTPVSDESEGE